MPMFVHLAPESRASRIRRRGIGRLRRPDDGHSGGLFAMPITSDFFVTHQWLRELRRRGRGAIVGIDFRIADDEPVWVGRYAHEHRQVTAAVAAAMFAEPEPRLGWEVVIPRRVAASEIHRIRALPQVVGWRYFPTAKGRRPFCTCKFCTRGEYGAARLRERLGTPDS
ncbi:hypothetical protein [Paludisphaera soli]|uniref:hypothetical protein n=1 Tax=Paludisphaera soli TaxID=2712865 RepID=UPI0013EBF69F|nr:hypothetical protein [Paludisphaera soli]